VELRGDCRSDVVRLIRVPPSVLGTGRLDRSLLVGWTRPRPTPPDEFHHFRSLRYRVASPDRHWRHRRCLQPTSTRRWRHAAVLLLAVIGIGLAIRGAVLEVLLATNAAGLRASIGPLETHGSLVLWNPCFAFGGAAIIVTASRQGHPHSCIASRENPRIPIRGRTCWVCPWFALVDERCGLRVGRRGVLAGRSGRGGSSLPTRRRAVR